MKNKIILFAVVVFQFFLNESLAQLYKGKYNEANYNESQVPNYILPDLMTSFDGFEISSVDEWGKIRKPEIIHFFEQNIYGEIPTLTSPIEKSFELISIDSTILGGLCTRKDIRITFKNKIGEVSMPLVLFVPNRTANRVPVILLANGSAIKSNRLELNNSQQYGQTGNGIPIHQLMTRGIGLATIDYQAFAQDRGNSEGKVSGGITNLFFKPGQEYTSENEWGMIAIWAYALRAGMDYLETDPDVNPKQVAPLGCSIGGKVALWAAVTDQRFGMALLSTAGHGGDAIWKRQFGETLENMCKYLPTWVCRNANNYAKNINEMPVDQHCLLATIAPRPLYIATAQHDMWADPKGQWIGTFNAAPAYKLYNAKITFTSSEQPPINHAVIESSIGYHVRSGVHGLELYDWEKYMQFIEYHFLKISPRSVNHVYFPEKNN